MTNLNSMVIANLGFALLIASGQPVFAEERVIEEIIVTAQKREQTLQEVPVSASVFSGEQLKKSRADDFKSIMLRTPGISGWSDGGGLTAISIRGVSSNNFGNGGDPSVGLFLNGVHSGTTAAFYDLDRVEIVKGPQSLLYGRGAASGAISVITAKADPSGNYGEIAVGGGERDSRRASFHANYAASEDLAFRFAGMHNEYDGFIKNGLGGRDLGFQDRDAFRVSAHYASSLWTTDAVLSWEDRERSAVIYSDIDSVTGVPTTGEFDTLLSDVGASARSDSRTINGSINISRKFDSGTLNFLTGFNASDFDYTEDSDGSELDFIVFRETSEVRYLSQEVTFVSDATDDGASWFVGFHAFTEDLQSDATVTSNEDVICQLFVGFGCATIIPGFVPQPNGYVEAGVGDMETKGASVYGDLRIPITGNFAVSAGLRANYDEREYHLASYPNVGDLYNAFGRLQILYAFESPKISTKDSWSEVTGRLLAEYALSEYTNLYVSASKGYKPGGFDSYGANPFVPGFPTATLGSDPEVNSFDPEVIWSYEIGAKGTFAEGRISYAIAVYTYDYEDLQQFVLPPTGVVTRVENVGEASGTGFEGELSWILNEYFDVFLGASYMDAEIDKIDVSTCALPNGLPCVGNKPGYTPERSGSAVINAHVPVGNSELLLTAEVIYSDDYFTGLANVPVTRVDAFTLVNYRATYAFNNRAEVTVFLENATDEDVFAGILDVPSLGFAFAFNPMHPRTFGIDFTWRFGE